MKRLSYQQYKKDFDLTTIVDGKSSGCEDNNAKYIKAFEYAVQTREFEIRLYWERAKYFWTFIAAAFAAFGIVQKLTTDDDKTFLSILISCLGLVFSFAWYCVNRGSKQWQENWENHVSLLEDKVTGPLFKIVLTRNDSQRKRIRDFFIGPGAFSVSKVNQLVSVYIIIFCLFLLIYSTPIFRDWLHDLLQKKWFVGINTVPIYIFPICLTFCACLIIYFLPAQISIKRNILNLIIYIKQCSSQLKLSLK